MRRELENNLIMWKNSERRKALILNGARQTGKTYILKEFAHNYYENSAYLNFETNPELKSIFENSLEPKKLVEKLSIVLKQKILKHKTLIIFDEVQLCSSALTSLKYFTEKTREYHVVAAGSLLGLNISSKTSFPVGKIDLLNLYPLSFMEFISSVESQYQEVIKNLNLGDSLEDIFHNELLELLNVYFFTGGMPEAVQAYIDNRDLNLVREIQTTILTSYIADFSKHVEPQETLKIRRIFESLPRQLSKENKKFIFSAVAKSARAREYEMSLQWLIDAGLFLKSNLVENPQIPLKSFSSTEAFKIFGLDVGLLGAMVKLEQSQVVLDKNLYFQFRGALVENYISQELTAYGLNPLYYWKSGASAELDFLIDFKGKVLGLEVKSGSNKRSRSLNVFTNRYPKTLSFRISKSKLGKNDNFFDLPLYMISEIKRFV